MAQPNQQALAALNPWQQKLFSNKPLSAIQANNPKAWQAYQAALGPQRGAPPGVLAPGPRPTAPAPGSSGGATAGGHPIRQLYQQMGGQKGTNMGLKAFKDWYRKESKAAGMDLAEYIEMSGLQAGSLNSLWGAMDKGGGGARGAPLPFTAGSTVRDAAGLNQLGQGLSDQGQLHWINKNTGQNYGSLEEAKAALALPFGFAGVKQWNTNVSGEGGNNLPGFLRDVRAGDIRYDPSTYGSLYGRLASGDYSAEENRKAFEEWNKLVPDWARNVDKSLQQQVDINREGQTGIPFGFEMLMDPDINVTNQGPLFKGQTAPNNLMQLGGTQAGEAALLSSLSIEELMRDFWPIAHAQYNRPAGSPAPFEAGLTFGSPVATGPVLADGTQKFMRSPLMGYSDEHPPDPDLIRLEGFAGQSVGEDTLYRELAGGHYARLNAYLQSQYQPDPIRQAFGLPQEDFWSLKEYAPFQNLPPDVLARVMQAVQRIQAYEAQQSIF